MSSQYTNDSFTDIFIYETSQNIQLLEQIALSCETGGFTEDSLNEIFRLVHTIKGSASMMLYSNISNVSHKLEDLFFFLRERPDIKYDNAELSEIVLCVIDFIKTELEKIKAGSKPDGEPDKTAEDIHLFLSRLKGENGGKGCQNNQNKTKRKLKSYRAVVFFEDGCQMENIRAFEIVHRLGGIASDIVHYPQSLVEDEKSAEIIAENGFEIEFKSENSRRQIRSLFEKTPLLKEYTLEELKQEQNPAGDCRQAEQKADAELKSKQGSIISVNIEKLDKLLNLAGELVTAEAMLISSAELSGLELPNFNKTAQHLGRIIDELQDVIMSTRLVPLTATFQMMNRIVHDMNKKLNKKSRLVIIGQDTEVDKKVIEHISDPLVHLIRNSVDHGIESPETRVKKGKPEVGTITLEAKNEGNYVVISIADDGRGFNKQSILEQAKKKNLLFKPEKEMTDSEIYSLVFLPGFSTKNRVSEYSGRGVGMDIVINNIQAIGGSISLESEVDVGSTISIKIPLTLAIINGMNVRVGSSIYSIPMNNIRESFRPDKSDIIKDFDGNEMVIIRGNCYPIYRLHERFGVKTDITDFEDGIFVIVEHDSNPICLFVDELLGQQPVVVKALPDYILKRGRADCFSGCTLLGDGSISLILNVGSLARYRKSS